MARPIAVVPRLAVVAVVIVIVATACVAAAVAMVAKAQTTAVVVVIVVAAVAIRAAAPRPRLATVVRPPLKRLPKRPRLLRPLRRPPRLRRPTSPPNRSKLGRERPLNFNCRSTLERIDRNALNDRRRFAIDKAIKAGPLLEDRLFLL